jgi:hypothetical protein
MNCCGGERARLGKGPRHKRAAGDRQRRRRPRTVHFLAVAGEGGQDALGCGVVHLNKGGGGGAQVSMCAVESKGLSAAQNRCVRQCVCAGGGGQGEAARKNGCRVEQQAPCRAPARQGEACAGQPARDMRSGGLDCRPLRLPLTQLNFPGPTTTALLPLALPTRLHPSNNQCKQQAKDGKQEERVSRTCTFPSAPAVATTCCAAGDRSRARMPPLLVLCSGWVACSA